MNCFRKILISHSRNLWRYHTLKSTRLLFSSAEFGIDSFILNKKVQEKSVKNPKLYKARMKEICASGDETLLFSDDVFKMLYLADTDEDLDTLHQMVLRIHSQDRIRIQNYNFGPEIMRLYHLLNKPVKALALMNDLANCPGFQASFNVLSMFLYLLFKNEYYNEVVEMYNSHILLNNDVVKVYRISVIYFATCYKLNTAESYKLALEAWKTFVIEKRELKPALRIRLFLAALALNQNDITCAMGVLYNKKFEPLSENIKCMVLAKSQRFNDVFDKIREILNSDMANQFFMLMDVVSCIEKEVNQSQKKQNITQFQTIKEELIKNSYIVTESLDKFLCSNLESSSKKSEKLKYEVKQKEESHNEKMKQY